MKLNNKFTKLIAISAASLVLAACGNMNKLDSHGNITTDTVKWGDVKKGTYKTNGTQTGMWSTQEALDQIPNLKTKAQIMSLFGRPHYGEGFNVREWNYVINHNTDKGVEQCQLKFLFNTKREVTGHMWNPVDCMVEKPAQMPVVEKPVEKFELRADFLFDFDKATLKAEGEQALSGVAQKIQRHEDIKEVVVVGHTDRLGSDEYNQKLSEKRAMTVSKYLAGEGVAPYKIKAYGAGETYPVKECDGNKATDELKACLADNRRVEISVH